ncbi:MAG: hypothetical protein LBK43_00405, partial [Treponema sp.]|nr:hypothetical protein [Treponema sp.]
MNQIVVKLHEVAQVIGQLNLYGLTHGGEGFGHGDLAGRDAADQHPLTAISGLALALAKKPDHTIIGERYQRRIRTTDADGIWIEVGDLLSGAVARTGIGITGEGTLQGEFTVEGMTCVVRQEGIYLRDTNGEYKLLDLRDSLSLTTTLQDYTDQRVAALRTDALVWQGSRKERELPLSGQQRGDYYWITDFDVSYPGQGKKGSMVWTVPAEGNAYWDIEIDAYREPDGITLVSRESDGALQVA